MADRLIVVVPPLDPDDAERAWEKWKADNPEVANRLNPQDIVKDVMCGTDHRMRIRYRIRSK